MEQKRIRQGKKGWLYLIWKKTSSSGLLPSTFLYMIFDWQLRHIKFLKSVVLATVPFQMGPFEYPQYHWLLWQTLCWFFSPNSWWHHGWNPSVWQFLAHKYGFAGSWLCFLYACSIVSYLAFILWSFNLTVTSCGNLTVPLRNFSRFNDSYNHVVLSEFYLWSTTQTLFCY